MIAPPLPEISIINHKAGEVHGSVNLDTETCFGVVADDALAYLRHFGSSATRGNRIAPLDARHIAAAGATIIMRTLDIDVDVYLSVDRFIDMADKNGVALPAQYGNLVAGTDINTITRAGIAVVALNSIDKREFTHAIVRTGQTALLESMLFLIKNGYAPRYEAWREMNARYRSLSERLKNKHRPARSLRPGNITGFVVQSTTNIVDSIDTIIQRFSLNIRVARPMVVAAPRDSSSKMVMSPPRDSSKAATSRDSSKMMIMKRRLISYESSDLADSDSSDSDEDTAVLLADCAALLRRVESTIKRRRK